MVAAAMGADADLAASRLARGCRCFVVQVEDAVAGYGWLSSGPEWIGELQLQITPRPGEAYIWNCVTIAEHRRKGIFRAVLLGISGVARREGLRRLWLGSVAIPAEKAVGPSGFKPALHFASVRVAGLHLMRVSHASERALASDALAVVSTKAGVHVRRSQGRRH